jgi:hypothetical protein
MPNQPGIWKKKKKKTDPDIKVADFSYQNDLLAEMITKAWSTPGYADKLTNHATKFARSELRSRGINLTRAVVLTEAEYNSGWEMRHADEVVFVLPNKSRARNVPAGQLLETAKLLMACVPNGI